MCHHDFYPIDKDCLFCPAFYQRYVDGCFFIFLLFGHKNHSVFFKFQFKMNVMGMTSEVLFIKVVHTVWPCQRDPGSNPGVRFDKPLLRFLFKKLDPPVKTRITSMEISFFIHMKNLAKLTRYAMRLSLWKACTPARERYWRERAQEVLIWTCGEWFQYHWKYRLPV